jgi:Cys-tRNA(Pro)/Cys-tRNA(Cys) deacylase
MKTNAVRLLEERGVAHELRAYEVDPDDLTAQTVADKVGLPAEQVFKTLVARGDRQGVCFAVVPGNCPLDWKALAKLTGDVRGGVTVLGAKKAYPVYVDETIELFEVVSISAGMRGLQILLALGRFPLDEYPEGLRAHPGSRGTAIASTEQVHSEEAAAHAGFCDQGQFSQHLKRLAGVTPRQFRTPARIAYRQQVSPRTRRMTPLRLLTSRAACRGGAANEGRRAGTTV